MEPRPRLQKPQYRPNTENGQEDPDHGIGNGSVQLLPILMTADIPYVQCP